MIPNTTYNKTNIVFEGNSLVQGAGATPTGNLANQIAAMHPYYSVSNQGHNGWNFSQMAANAAVIDALYVPGKINILVQWEETNTEFGSASSVNGVQQHKDLCAARLAVHPWYIILITTLPRESSVGANTTMTAENQRLIDYDNYLRANWRDMGAAGLVDVRQAGSPFANVMPPYADADFLNVGAYWSEAGTANYKVHLNDAGYAIVAQYLDTAITSVLESTVAPAALRPALAGGRPILNIGRLLMASMG